MQPTSHIWHNGTLVPWDQAQVHVLAHALHYGSAVFEGIRCYETPNGTAIFRLEEHIDRLIYSGDAIDMDIPYTKDQLAEACTELVRTTGLKEGYIRPLAFYGYGKMGLNPIGAPVDVIIACWPWGAYLGGDTVKIKISDFIRIHPKTSVTDAKISGHYVNSIQASLEVHGDDRFDEALFLDYEGNIAEGPGENIFLIKDGVLHTPRRDHILPGITRDCLMTIAHDKGIEVVERTIRPHELFEVDEALFTGTAAEISGIVSVDEKPIGSGEMGPITRELKDIYANAVRGREEKYASWLSVV